MLGEQVGTTTWNVYRDTRRHGRVLRKQWNITVLPQPEIQEIHCETEVGKSCSLNVRNGGHSYRTNIPLGYYTIKSHRNGLQVHSDRSGTFTFYLQSYYGRYYTHKFVVTVKPKPPKERECEIAV